MNKFIVTTTINNPTLALKKYAKLKDWTLIVVGDLKTPEKKYQSLKNIIWLGTKDQLKLSKKLSNLIGWNCIQRRNFGFLLAFKLGAKIVASVDDDNIPYDNWGKTIHLNKKNNINLYKSKISSFDPLSIFNYPQKIWHRGYPLQLLQNPPKIKKLNSTLIPDIQANLWDMAPDIDAMNRMSLKNEHYKFKVLKPYSSNKIMPFNSQNTILSREAIKNYFMFPHIGRMDDIWAAFYVQSLGFKVIFDKPTVYQKRNEHNIYNDFLKELIGYKNNLSLINSLYKNPNNIKKFLPKESYEAFEEYKKLFV
ncbi:hypothetical protein OAJ75_04965 [Candidatus Pelagibacter sp.]|nr:hypothetical protein [Candidatus Pelagibacter sp.]